MARGYSDREKRIVDYYGSEMATMDAYYQRPSILRSRSNYGDPNRFKTQSIPGLPVTSEQEMALFQQMYPDALLGPAGPSWKDQMDTSGPRFVQDPYADHQMMDLSHLPEYSGTSFTPYQFDDYNYIPGGTHPFQNSGTGLTAGTPMDFDDPIIAGTRITAPGGPAGSFGPDYGASPEQMRAMQEQIGGPGFHSPPRFAAANQAQMGPLSSVTLGKSDPNFYAPEFTRSAKPGGLLDQSPTGTTKQSGWMKDPKMAAALAGLLLQSGSNQSRDDDWDW